MKMKLWKKCTVYVLVGLFLALIYFPLLMIIIFSFTPTKALGRWDGFNPLYYAKIFFDKEVMPAVGNSLLIALCSAVLATIIGTTSAVGVYNLSKKAKTAANTINQITVINSEIVTAAAFMLLFVLSRDFIMNAFNADRDTGGFAGMLLAFVTNDYVKLVIAHTMITIPFVILAVTPRLTQLNPNIYEAGLDLGASPRGALFRVLVPQLVPGMVSGFIMAFTLSLDDFVLTNFVKDEVETISTTIYNSIPKGGVDPKYRVLSALILYTVFGTLIAVNLIKKRKMAAKLNSATAKIITQKERL